MEICQIICSPFKDLTYDCQNLAFLFGVSLRPIMSRCCLNIFAANYCYVSRSLERK
jgi:hypothetical protein